MNKTTINLILIAILVIGLAILTGGVTYIVISLNTKRENISFMKSLDCIPYKDQSKNQQLDLNRTYEDPNQNIYQDTQSLITQTIGDSPLQNRDILANQNIEGLTYDDVDFINACENEMSYAASPASVAKFNAFKTLNINPPNPYTSIESIANNTQSIINDEFIQKLHDTTGNEEIIIFYNVLINIFSEKTVKHLVYNVDIDESNNSDGVVAYTKFGFFGSTPLQCITLGPDTFDALQAEKEYETGFWSNPNPIETWIHETGHALAMYAWLTPPIRDQLNNLSDPSSLNNLKAINNNGFCSGNWENFFTNDTGLTEKDVQGYYRDPTTNIPSSIVEQYLVDYIAQKVGIDINNITINKQEMRKAKLLAAWSYIQSGYGRFGVEKNLNEKVYVGGTGELFAEAFSQWYLTDPTKRALNWQVLNDFFTSGLNEKFHLNPNLRV